MTDNTTVISNDSLVTASMTGQSSVQVTMRGKDGAVTFDHFAVIPNGSDPISFPYRQAPGVEITELFNISTPLGSQDTDTPGSRASQTTTYCLVDWATEDDKIWGEFDWGRLTPDHWQVECLRPRIETLKEDPQWSSRCMLPQILSKYTDWRATVAREDGKEQRR